MHYWRAPGAKAASTSGRKGGFGHEGSANIGIAYGRGHPRLCPPDRAEATIVPKKPLPALADPPRAVRGAMMAPIACASLDKLAAGKRSACILICDVARPVPNRLFLRPMTIKCMVTPLDILAPGGTLIVASECSEGFGSAEFRDAQVRLVDLGPERFLATLTARTRAEVDEWQTEMQVKSMRVGRIELYTSGLSGADRAATGVAMITDIDAAIAASTTRSGETAMAIIPEGPCVVPCHLA